MLEQSKLSESSIYPSAGIKNAFKIEKKKKKKIIYIYIISG